MYTMHTHTYIHTYLQITRLGDQGEFRAFSGKGSTWLYIAGPQLGTLLSPKVRPSIRDNPPMYFTHALEGVYYDESTDILHGWTHVETLTCDFGYFHGEVMYSYSTDKGLNWVPSRWTYEPNVFTSCPNPGRYGSAGYPPTFSSGWTVTSGGPYVKNTAQTVESGTRNSGIGKHWIVVDEASQMLYMHHVDFWAEDDNGRHTFGVCLARATVASLGRPGTWTKYYKGRWSEPGIGGKCSKIEVFDSDHYLKGVVTIPFTVAGEKYYMNLPQNNIGQIHVSQSAGRDDGWYRLNGAMMPAMQPESPGEADGALPWYFFYTAAAVDENGQWWLYGALQSSDSYPIRSTARWPMTWTRQAGEVCGTRLQLTQYLSSRPVVNRRVSMQPLDATWTKVGPLGYTTTCFGHGTSTISECRIRSSGLYFIASDGECERRRPAPDGSGSDLQWLSSLGRILVNPYPGLVALRRCFVYVGANYFTYALGNNPCPSGSIEQKVLGYIIPMDSGTDMIGVFSSSDGKWQDPFLLPTPSALALLLKGAGGAPIGAVVGGVVGGVVALVALVAGALLLVGRYRRRKGVVFTLDDHPLPLPRHASPITVPFPEDDADPSPSPFTFDGPPLHHRHTPKLWPFRSTSVRSYVL